MITYKGQVKRTIDIIASICGLMATFPLLIVIATLIRREDGGGVFYRGVRVGKEGSTFRIYKFRTMVMNAELIGGPSTAEDDPRITKVGKILRKYKLDELPQLINVLKGEMSLVGPRPEIPSEVETYSEEERRILTVKPGITDWASIAFRNEGEILAGSDDPHKAYREKIKPEKIRLALKYVDEISFKTDVKIILQTVKAVLAG
ncbi:MAG: sugar transferase [Actinobacteria bacterium]|nr:sugar transferase [Actinomycetota bacterium]